MADKLHWTPTAGGWRQGESISPGLMLTTRLSRPDFQGFDFGLPTQALRPLNMDGQSQKDNVKTALGGVWHEAHVHAEFGVGDLCIPCGEAAEDLEHIVHHCPAGNAEHREVGSQRREVGAPASALDVPMC
eukprot:367147-Amphidinium_carterae.2